MVSGKVKSWLAVSASFIFFIFFTTSVDAASLFLSPATGAFSLGKSFSVSVYVSSADQSINAVSGTLSFPSNLLQVVSLSKSGSVMSLWVQEPGFSNGAGTVNFEGVVLNPGYIGSSGKIITINFKTKAIGTALVNFSSSSVLANDGQGTNILTGAGSGRFDVAVAATESTASESTTPTEAVGTPLAPKIISSTHPDPDKWYSNSDPSFSWTLPSGVTAVNFLADQESTTNPGTSSDGKVSAHVYTNVDDGVWYMHLRFKNTLGWGAVAHRKFQIDTVKPSSFSIQENERTDLTEPVAAFIFQASDATSGIDHYDIQIDANKTESWHDDGSHVYHTSALPPGHHTLLAKAVDKAGNSLADSLDFDIEALDPPLFTEYPKELAAKDTLVAKGEAQPNMTVQVWLQREEDEPRQYSFPADSQGHFTFVASERVRDGVYKLWGEVVNAKLAHSNPSAKLTIYVRPSAFTQVTSQLTWFLSLLIPLLALVLLLLAAAWYFWHKFKLLRKKLKKEVREAELSLHKSFDLLRDSVREKLKLLEKAKSKRELTEEEARIIKQLRQDLDKAERAVQKEIGDIDKLMK